MFTFEFLIKTLFSAFIISVIAYISRKNTTIGGLIASLPLTSILALVWMYHDGSSVQSMIDLSQIIFWMVIPSLIFFIVFPIFLRMNFPFYGALISSSLILIVTYALYTQLLSLFNIKL
jgi:uncharacterized membrane protein (GlpM family)